MMTNGKPKPRKLSDNKELVQKMVNSVAKPKNRFDALISQTTLNFVMRIIIPLVEALFEKYDEDYFHKRMAAGFDFIEDWKENHTIQYKTFLKLFKRLRNRLKIDLPLMYNIIVEIFIGRGWVLTDGEKYRILYDMEVLMKEVYGAKYDNGGIDINNPNLDLNAISSEISTNKIS